MMKPKQLSLILAVSLISILGESLQYTENALKITSHAAIAQTCVAATSCPPQPIQFIPGETVTVEVINRTTSLVAIEQIQGTDAFTLDPGKTISFLRGGSVNPNFSVVLWDVQGLSLQFRLSQPQKKLLRVEVYLGDGDWYDDRTIYLRNDGRLDIF